LGTHDGNDFLGLIPGSSFAYLGLVAGNTYFINNLAGLYKTNGTPSGTVSLGSTGINSTNIITSGVVVGSSMYFMGVTFSGGFDLWKSDGSTATTVVVKHFATAGTDIPLIIGTNAASLYFTISNPSDTSFPGQQLWQSNGTAAGTLKITRPFNVASFTSQVSDRLYFVANGDVQIMPAALNSKASAGWATAYGLASTNTAASADPDKDSRTNLRELLQGTNPNSGVQSLPCPLLSGTTLATASVSIPALAIRHGVSVWLETSTDLQTWQRTPTTPLTAPNTLMDDDCLSYPFTTTRFYRFSALEP
jgi:ELWxxDGT repeat protein